MPVKIRTGCQSLGQPVPAMKGFPACINLEFDGRRGPELGSFPASCAFFALYDALHNQPNAGGRYAGQMKRQYVPTKARSNTNGTRKTMKTR